MGLVLVGALSNEWATLYLIIFEGMQLKILAV